MADGRHRPNRGLILLRVVLHVGLAHQVHTESHEWSEVEQGWVRMKKSSLVEKSSLHSRSHLFSCTGGKACGLWGCWPHDFECTAVKALNLQDTQWRVSGGDKDAAGSRCGGVLGGTMLCAA